MIVYSVKEKDIDNQNEQIRNTNDENIMNKNASEEKHMNKIENSAFQRMNLRTKNVVWVEMMEMHKDNNAVTFTDVKIAKTTKNTNVL